MNGNRQTIFKTAIAGANFAPWMSIRGAIPSLQSPKAGQSRRNPQPEAEADRYSGLTPEARTTLPHRS